MWGVRVLAFCIPELTPYNWSLQYWIIGATLWMVNIFTTFKIVKKPKHMYTSRKISDALVTQILPQNKSAPQYHYFLTNIADVYNC